MEINDFYFAYKIIETFKKTATKFGYSEFFVDTLNNYSKHTENNKTIKFINLNGELINLINDPTISLTKYLSKLNKKNIYKYFYLSKSFSWDLIDFAKERLELGIEYFGNRDIDSDIEIVYITLILLKKLKINDFKFDIGNVNFLHSLLAELNIDLEDEKTIISLVDRKNIPDLKNFIENLNIDLKYQNILLEIPKLFGKADYVIKRGYEISCNENMEKSIQALEYTINSLSELTNTSNFEVDLGFSNKQEYYSDLIFKIYSKDLNKSIISGGRYNKLSKKFNSDIPALGFMLDIKNTIEVIKMKNNFNLEKNSDFTIIYKEDNRTYAYSLANTLREKGFKVTTNINNELTSSYLSYDFFKDSSKIINIENEKLIVIDQVKNTSIKTNLDDFLRNLQFQEVISIH